MNWNVGDRLECDGHRGTILFIGEVPPTKGTWYGVEWDDPSRGKHDGTHQGTAYFTTRKAGAGSFVRASKIGASRDFAQALTERYTADAGQAFADETLLRELQNEMNAPYLELVGLDKISRKQSKLNELRIAVLNQMRVSRSGENLYVMCPNIRELNLSGNLFHSWHPVADIARQLTHLHVLNISDNKLSIPENPRLLEPSFRSLKSLIAGNMDYDWKDVVQCSVMWPQIEQLAVPMNNIRCLEFMNNDTFCHLKVLNLEGNAIENWEEVNKLGQLPCLEQLSLYGTGLKNILVKENSFAKLAKLSLSNNKINQWVHVSELDKMLSLVDLKICGNTGLEADSYETFLQWIMARIGRLEVLNGSRITSDERRGAEWDYVKHHGKVYLKCLELASALAEFRVAHPRYQSLVDKYGAPELGEMERKPVTLRNTLITLNLTRGEQTLAKRLPSTMVVQKLKTLCHRLFQLGSAELDLYAISSAAQTGDVQVALDNDLRPLSFYSLEDGDTVVVKEF